MNQNNIFIFEYVSGGGFNNIELPSSLFCEGFAMLRSLIYDFKKLDYEITSLLDQRISYLSQYLRADFIEIVNPNDDFIVKFKDNLNKCKYCFIIAPEFSNILYNLTKLAFKMDKVILSVKLHGIQLATSKLATYNYFKTYALLTPKTNSVPYKKNNLDINFIIKKLNELNTPIIIKPDDGVGAESIYFFENKSQIVNFFKRFPQKFDLSRKYILQEYISGDDLSISMINYENSNPIILSVNSQFINIKNLDYDSQYYGGYTPIKNIYSIKKLLEESLKRLDLTMFNSYFGIDFIKSDQNRNYFVEINPRLTTSYIGIRNTIKQNPVELILNPKENNCNNSEIEHFYFSKFCRLDLKHTDYDINRTSVNKSISKLMKNIPELITPPIMLNNKPNQVNQIYSCFIATKTKDQDSSNTRIRQIIDLLKSNGFALLN